LRDRSCDSKRREQIDLIDPIGLWCDDMPVTNWMLLPDDERRRAMFANPAGQPAQAFFSLPAEGESRIEAQAAFVWAQACTGKFVWPIPDKGLKKRIHRVTLPTLIIWGRADRVIAPAYAEEFARRIANSRIELIDGASHLPHLEQAKRVAQLVDDFLKN
jgi:pimeloyl-ACP methyl ester carboxylesterase